MIVCPKCKEELEDGAVFCTNCGTKLSITCPKCGKILKSGAKFCSGCGANLAEHAKNNVCPNCGAELEEGAKFCDQCGCKIGGNEVDDKKDEIQLHAERTVQDSLAQSENGFDFITSINSKINTDEEVSSYKNDYKRGKSNITVGTIGHLDHGKTTLTAAITAYSARKFNTKEWNFYEIDNSPEEQERGITINHHYVEYQTDRRHYTHIDCPGHVDYVKNMITGVAQMDGAVLVISATDGVMDQTKEHLLLARQFGVPKGIVFLNKVDQLDGDEEMLVLVEEDVKYTIQEYGFSADTPIIKGSAYNALYGGDTDCIDELLEVMDSYFDDPVCDESKPFFMPISDICEIPDQGTVVIGRIKQGIVKPKSPVELLGIHRTQNDYVTSMKIFDNFIDVGHAGSTIAILLSDIKRKNVVRGQVLAKPGSIHLHTTFEARIYVLTKEEGGRHSPFFTGYCPQFYFRTTNITGTVELEAGTDMVKPGDNVKIIGELIHPIAMDEGLKLAIRDGGRTIACGQITRIIE
nr:elongation factor Tu [Treponema sp.]